MEIRMFKKEDYDIVKSWWDQRDQVAAPIEFLSDYGVIAFQDEKPIAAIWFYPMLSVKFGFIKSPVTNPDTTKEERDEALNGCLDILHFIAKDLGYTHVLCPSNVPAFQDRLKSLGYAEGDKDCIHFWGGL